jgi:hypothetical protein
MEVAHVTRIILESKSEMCKDLLLLNRIYCFVNSALFRQY